MGNVCGCSGKGEQLLTAVEAEDKEAVQEILHAQSPKATRQLARYNSFVSRRTPLLCAAARGNAEILDILLRAGADVDFRSFNGQTALMIACRYGHREAVQMLLMHNADVHMMDVTNGRTALHYAVSGGKVQCARLLLCDHIASVPVKLGKQRMDGGYTVQVCEDAKWANSPGRSLYVLVNARADKGITPLHLAAMNGHPETLGLLLDAGARVNAMTRSDGDFLDVSVMGMHNSPLHYAASSGNLLCCQMLIAHGADRAKENGNGWTPHYVAKLWRHRRTLEELLDPGQPLPVLPLFQPSRYLALPLMSIMRVARSDGIHGCMREEDVSMRGGQVEPVRCCATDRVCPVCLERHCTVAADGCNHELCTLCALNLCSVGASIHNAHTTAAAGGASAAAAPAPAVVTAPVPEQTQAPTPAALPEGTAPALSALGGEEGGEDRGDPGTLPAPGGGSESAGGETQVGRSSNGAGSVANTEAPSPEPTPLGSSPAEGGHVPEAGAEAQTGHLEVQQHSSSTGTRSSSSGRTNTTLSASAIAGVSGSQAQQGQPSGASASASGSAGASAASSAAPFPTPALIGSLPCPLCRHPIFCFFALPKATSLEASSCKESAVAEPSCISSMALEVTGTEPVKEAAGSADAPSLKS